MPSKLHALPLACALACAAIPDTISASTIGLYTDASGSSCSFSGNDPGMIKAYVVITPDGEGIRSVEFAAVIPACLGATYLYDAFPDGVGGFGSSPTGISVSFPFCAIEPALAVEINYYRGGSTTPCCEFVISEHPLAGSIEGVDCSLNAAFMFPATSRFNADSSCECFTPPPLPFSPGPAHDAAAVSVFSGLSWLPAESEPGIASYDVHLGTTTSPPLVANVLEPSYQPVQLQELTQYYWQVVIHDDLGGLIPGPVWTFTTRPLDSPPTVPMVISPGNGMTQVSSMPTLIWTESTDVDGDLVVYDLYLGTSSDPPLIVSDLAPESYAVISPLAFMTTYYWKVIARDEIGLTSTDGVWSFSTGPENYPPGIPGNPSPLHAAVGVPIWPTLQWSCIDPEGDPVRFDVYFGTTPSPPLLASNISATSYPLTLLSFTTDYYWRIVARDDHAGETSGPVWRFRTGVNSPPNFPSCPSPFGVTAPVDITLTWCATDPDRHPLTFDVYFGNTGGTSMSLVSTNQSATSYDPGLLSYHTTYWWQVVARDPTGAERTAGVWFFVTQSQPTGAGEIPIELALGRNHPNPFNPQTMIPYSVPRGKAERVRMSIHDTSGRLVNTLVDEIQNGGQREVVWAGDDHRGVRVASGVYYCVLQVGGERRTQKMVLLK